MNFHFVVFRDSECWWIWVWSRFIILLPYWNIPLCDNRQYPPGSLCKTGTVPHRNKGFCGPGRISPANTSVDSTVYVSFHPPARLAVSLSCRSRHQEDDAKDTWLRVSLYRFRISGIGDRTRRYTFSGCGWCHLGRGTGTILSSGIFPLSRTWKKGLNRGFYFN